MHTHTHRHGTIQRLRVRPTKGGRACRRGLAVHTQEHARAYHRRRMAPPPDADCSALRIVNWHPNTHTLIHLSGRASARTNDCGTHSTQLAGTRSSALTLSGGRSVRPVHMAPPTRANAPHNTFDTRLTPAHNNKRTERAHDIRATNIAIVSIVRRPSDRGAPSAKVAAVGLPIDERGDRWRFATRTPTTSVPNFQSPHSHSRTRNQLSRLVYVCACAPTHDVNGLSPV